MTIERDAERAVIGAILLEPDRLDDVREWLEPRDFGGTAERLVFESIIDMSKDGQEVKPDAVNQRLLERTEHRHLPADAPLLVTCAQECPSAERAATYGRMVLETSIRRRIADAAAGLRQQARLAAGPGELTRVFAMVDTVRREVEALHQREASANGALSPTPVNVDGLSSIPRHRNREAYAIERHAVLSFIERPQALGAVKAWLRPDDFRDRECALQFRQMLVMDEARMPIDRLTLSWALAQRGLPTQLAKHGERLPVGSDPILAGRRVLEQSVRSTVIEAAAAVEGGMARKDGPPATAVAYRRLNDLWPQQRRLISAVHRNGGSPRIGGALSVEGQTENS